MDKKLLAQLGLQPKEVALYQAIFKAKAITPTALAKAVGVKRTTVYSMARSLIEKGLIREDANRRPRVFVVADSNDLDSVISSEQKKAEERLKVLKQMQEEMHKYQSAATYPVPTIKFVEEQDIIKFMHGRIKTWTESMGKYDSIFWGYQDPSLLNFYQPWIKAFWDKAPKSYEVRLLTNSKDEEEAVKGKYERRYTKYWYGAADFLSTTWVIGDYIVTLNTLKHPFYLIEIHDKLIAHDQREMFKNLWDILK